MLCGGTPMESGHCKDARETPFQTMPLDRLFLSLCHKANPNVLIIPTAMEEFECHADCEKGIVTHYSKWLQCPVKVLYMAAHYEPKETEKMLLWADCIYISGGNPEFLLKIWKENGFDNLILNYINQDKPVMGISAGAMIFFDEVFCEVAGETELAPIGLGIIEGACFPHFNREKNKKLKDKFATPSNNTPLLALDDGVCVAFSNRQTKVYSLSETYNAYKIIKGNLKVLNKTVVTQTYL